MSMQAKEQKFIQNCSIVDEETKEVFEKSQFSRDEWNEMSKFPVPWELFRIETAAFMAEEPEVTGGISATGKSTDNVFDRNKSLLVEELIRQGYRKDEEGDVVIPPVFVSRMPRHKVNGRGHDATIRSGRKFEEKGILISKTSLLELKLGKSGEIENYEEEAKKSDPLLYNALVEALKNNGNNANKAFPEGIFHKPKADGTEGPIVRKIKTFKNRTTVVAVNEGAGVCYNDSMVRIDLFQEDGKYYFVPIYTSEIVKKKLPMKAATAKKPYAKWKVMKEENFKFSLYPGDLIEIVQEKGRTIKMVDVDKNAYEVQRVLGYYNGADTESPRFNGETHDKSFTFRVAIQSVESIRKFQVDVLGNFHEVRQEKRQTFADRKPSKLYKKK